MSRHRGRQLPSYSHCSSGELYVHMYAECQYKLGWSVFSICIYIDLHLLCDIRLDCGRRSGTIRSHLGSYNNWRVDDYSRRLLPIHPLVYFNASQWLHDGWYTSIGLKVALETLQMDLCTIFKKLPSKLCIYLLYKNIVNTYMLSNLLWLTRSTWGFYQYFTFRFEAVYI